jgi:glucokinase
MAGHVGHICVDTSSEERGITGMPGSLEEAIGNSSVARRSHGIYPSTMQLLEGYRQGDPFAAWLWLSSVRKLSLAIASLCHVLSPQLVILSGGITQANEDLMKPLKRFLALYEWRPGGKETDIAFARFSDLAGAIGAAGFALMKS